MNFEPYLFVSTVSPASIACMDTVARSGIPFRVIRLDTKEARESALSGQHFSIDSVPTLMVVHPDGNMQLMKGKDKIIQWTVGTVARLRAPPVEEPTMIELPPKKKKKPKAKAVASSMQDEESEEVPEKKRNAKKVHFEEEEIETGGVELLFEGEENANQGSPVIEQRVRTSGKKSNADLLAAAKRMAEQRKESLGYDA